MRRLEKSGILPHPTERQRERGCTHARQPLSSDKLLCQAARLEELGRIFTGIDQCLNLVDNRLTIGGISHPKPLRRRVEYRNRSLTRLDEVVDYQRDKELGLDKYSSEYLK